MHDEPTPHETRWVVTIPLILLAGFALFAGWAGIPEAFPGIGPAINNNYFHHFVGSTIYKLMEELYELHLVDHAIETLPFNWEPLVTSLFVALGGLFLGYGERRAGPRPMPRPELMVGTAGRPRNSRLDSITASSSARSEPVGRSVSRSP